MVATTRPAGPSRDAASGALARPILAVSPVFHRQACRVLGLGALLGLLLLGAQMPLGAAAEEDGERRSYILATATPGGTFYPVGVALATLVKLKSERGISLSAISSAGSGENIKLLMDNEAQFAILIGLFGEWASKGKERYAALGPQDNLRAVTALWKNVDHFILRSDLAATGTVEDLAGLGDRRFSIGRRNSGTEASGREILRALGLDPEALGLVHLGYGPSADALQNGTIVGINAPGGVPIASVTRVLATLGTKVRLLEFTDEQLARVKTRSDLWSRYVIPANTYPGQSEPVETIALPNFLAVRGDVDEEVVYVITKMIFENLPFLNGIHKATRAITLDKATADLPVPLHPGAARYFREAGLSLPETPLAD